MRNGFMFLIWWFATSYAELVESSYCCQERNIQVSSLQVSLIVHGVRSLWVPDCSFRRPILSIPPSYRPTHLSWAHSVLWVRMRTIETDGPSRTCLAWFLPSTYRCPIARQCEDGLDSGLEFLKYFWSLQKCLVFAFVLGEVFVTKAPNLTATDSREQMRIKH